MKGEKNNITFRAVFVGALLSAVFAALTVLLENRQAMLPTANQIPLFPYVFLILTVLALNPLCRLLRVLKAFTKAEILIIFTMGMVASGISTFGLTSQLVPAISSLHNSHWNNEQSQWDRYVEPFLADNYFVSEPGLNAAAREHREALLHEAELRRTLEAALMRKPEQAPLSGANAGTGLPPAEEILRTYPEKLRQQQELVLEKKTKLRKLEKIAADKVEIFRRGLPRGKRAFPGALPVIGVDDTGAYFARVQRLLQGRKAASQLHAVRNILKPLPVSQALNPSQSASVVEMLNSAAEALSPISEAGPLESTGRDLNATRVKLTAEIVELREKIAGLNADKRKAEMAKARSLERDIEDLTHDKAKLEEEEKQIGADVERNLARIESATRILAAHARLQEIAASVGSAPGPEAGKILQEVYEVLGMFPSFDASLRRFFLGDVPWSHWMRPLVYWAGLIGLTYLVLMAFNVLIFRQWAYNEKLIYPLAELPEILAGHDAFSEENRIPAVFRNGLFWAGFGISAAVLGWNLLCKTEWVPGMQPLDLINMWSPYIVKTQFEGLGQIGRSSLFFTMIGLAFLIPTKVSFSMWFFWLFFMIQMLVLIWTGHGQTEKSFPKEWWYTLNFCTAQGGGALIVFASVVFFKCRKYLLCSLYPASVQGLELDERRELRFSSATFLAGTVAILLVLWKGMHVHPLYAIFGFAVIMMITIGLVRAVAEGGVLGFQAWVSPFHFIRHTFGFDKAWTASSFVAPLMVYYSVLFLDIKAFIAPAMANGLKIRDDLKMARGRFHLAVALCIVIAAVVGVASAIMLAYASGADSMQGWFYTGFPRGLYDRIAEMAKTPPAATASGQIWLASGALMMAALLFFRQRIFWLPHPIGLIMLVNPIMRTFWFSIFVGWLAKSLITKYGNKESYSKVRGLFVGLIAGELVVVTIAMVVSLVLQKNMGIDLNRN